MPAAGMHHALAWRRWQMMVPAGLTYLLVWPATGWSANAPGCPPSRPWFFPLAAKSTTNSTIDRTIVRAYSGFYLFMIRYPGENMASITANELKTRGISSIQENLVGEPEAIITVRGRQKYVVMDIAHYHYLRECELEAALLEAQADVAKGRVMVESVAAHIARISDGL